jgi:ribosomal 30S subunit maturation factor RimM
MRGRRLRKFSKERSRTGQSEEDDLLVGELLGGVVVDGDTASGDIAGLLGPGDVTVLSVSNNFFWGRPEELRG